MDSAERTDKTETLGLRLDTESEIRTGFHFQLFQLLLRNLPLLPSLISNFPAIFFSANFINLKHTAAK